MDNLRDTIMQELEKYVNTSPAGQVFDLLSASPSFASISMVHGDTPNVTRALIGRCFESKVGKAPFANVRVAMLTNKYGKTFRRRSPNNANMYEIV